MRLLTALRRGGTVRGRISNTIRRHFVRKTDEEKLLFLEALEEAGVDNWEGYDEAVEIYQQKLNGSDEETDDMYKALQRAYDEDDTDE